MAIVGTDPLHQVLEPEITLLDCRIEHVEARRHGITPWGVLEAQPRVEGNDGIDLAQEAARRVHTRPLAIHNSGVRSGCEYTAP